MEGQVEKCVVLKQIPAKLQDLKKGELYRVQMRNEEGQLEWTDWQVALTNAIKEESGRVSLNSDTVHLIMGRPELVSIIATSSGASIRKATDIGGIKH